MASGVHGRNDPCPCGSGKKYKKCCLVKGEPAPGGVDEEREAWAARVHEDLRLLEEWTNEGEKAVKDGDFGRVEELCKKIQERFPGMIQGRYLLGKLSEAQGRWAEAVSAYEDALKVIEGDRESFDEEVIKEIKGHLEEARARRGA